MFGEKVRKTQAQPFERTAEVQRQHAMSVHRLMGYEQCRLCPRDTCNGSCETAEGCQCAPIQLSQMPSPTEPQPVVLSKPSIWTRIKAAVSAWWRRNVIDTMEDHS